MAATSYKIGLTDSKNNISFVLVQGIESKNKNNPTSTESVFLKDFSFKAEMYSFNTLEIVVVANNISLENYADITLSMYKVNTDDNETTKYIAQNYYVVEKRIKVKSQTSKEYTLKSHSADYFLTIDKFCQAFTGRTLIDGIVSPSLKNCSSPNFTLFRKLVDQSANIKESLQNFLPTSIIPYAVQYNESFYDFLVRLCSRDGEFLYFGTDNKLHIGLEKIIGNVSDPVSEEEYIQSYNNQDFTNWSNLDYLGELNNSKNYIDSFNTAASNTESNLNSFCGVLAPEYLENLEEIKKHRKDYSDVDDHYGLFSEIRSSLYTLATEQTVLDSVASLTKMQADRWIHISSSINGTNDKFDNKFKYIYKNDKAVERTYLYADSSRSDTSYKAIYNKMEASQASQIKLKVVGEEFPNLGDIIERNSNNFVVYKLDVKFITTEKNEYTQIYEMLLVKCEKSNNTEPLYNAYPLPMPEKRFRKASTQRAKVMDNFDPSRLGRVRVKFPWQKETDTKQDNDKKINEDNNWTPWIRVASPMASDGAGFFFTPAEGDEVIIDFENENIEYPYVNGAFYNDSNKPGAAAQTQTHGKVKSISSANGHHISFTDNGGLERYMANFLPLSKYITSFGNQDQATFDSKDAKYFGGGFEISDFYGIYSITGSSHNRSINVSSPYGDVSIDAFTGITIDAPLGDVKIVGKNVSIEARNNLTIESGTNIQGYFKNKNNYLKIPDAIIKNVSSKVGLDLSFFRNYLEVFLRPIGGTTLIKSNRYMRIEAGEGNTVPNDSIKGLSEAFRSPIFQQKTKLSEAALKSERVYDIFKTWCTKYNDFLTRFEDFRKTSGLKDLTLMNNGNIKSLNELTEEPKYREHYAELSALRIELISLEKAKDKLDLEDVRELPKYDDIESKWKAFKAIELPLKKRVVYENLKRVVDNDVSIYGKIIVEPLPSSGFPSKLEDYVKIIDKTTEVGLSQHRNLFGAGGFIDLKDDRTWESTDKGAILFSDSEKTFFKIGNKGEFIQGFNYDYRDEFMSLIYSINE